MPTRHTNDVATTRPTLVSRVMVLPPLGSLAPCRLRLEAVSILLKGTPSVACRFTTERHGGRSLQVGKPLLSAKPQAAKHPKRYPSAPVPHAAPPAAWHCAPAGCRALRPRRPAPACASVLARSAVRET